MDGAIRSGVSSSRRTHRMPMPITQSTAMIVFDVAEDVNDAIANEPNTASSAHVV